MAAAIALGTMTFTMSALPGTPALQNAIPMPFFGTTPFAAPGLGIIAAVIMLTSACGGSGAQSKRQSRGRRLRRESATPADAADQLPVRERADNRKRVRSGRDQRTGGQSEGASARSGVAFLPLVVVILVNLAMSLPRPAGGSTPVSWPKSASEQRRSPRWEASGPSWSRWRRHRRCGGAELAPSAVVAGDDGRRG